MPGSKAVTSYDFIKILKSFSRMEVNEFHKFLRSPLFNNHTTLIRLYSELKKFHPDYNNSKLTKEYLYNIVSGGKKYNDIVIRKYFSLLFKLSLEYLNYVELRDEKAAGELNVLCQLMKRDIKNVYNKKLADINKFFHKTKIKPENFYYLHRLNEIKDYYNASNDKIKNKNKDSVESIRNLMTYFISTAGMSYNQVLLNAITYNDAERIHFLELILSNLDFDAYLEKIKESKTGFNKSEILLLELMRYDYKLNSKNEGNDAYNNLNKILLANKEKIDDSILQYFMKRLISFCITERLRGNYAYDRHLFDNYKFILDNNLFFVHGKSKINYNDFKAILFSALKNGEFDWAEKFIHQAEYHSENILRIDIHNIGIAYLEFHKKNFESALLHLTRINSKQTNLSIETYTLKARIFYELNYKDSALSLTDTLRHFLKNNNDISVLYKQGMLNFIKYYKKFFTLRELHDLKKLQEVQNSINANENVRMREWLLMKSNELSENVAAHTE